MLWGHCFPLSVDNKTKAACLPSVHVKPIVIKAVNVSFWFLHWRKNARKPSLERERWCVCVRGGGGGERWRVCERERERLCVCARERDGIGPRERCVCVRQKTNGPMVAVCAELPDSAVWRCLSFCKSSPSYPLDFLHAFLFPSLLLPVGVVPSSCRL